MENEKKNNLRGLAGTLLFHGVLLGLFLFFGFTTPLPLPAEQGIAINFGSSDQGMGDVQPENSGDNQAQNDAPASRQTTASSSSGQQQVATQDVEAAPVVRPNPNHKVTPRNTDPTPKPTETPVEDPKPTVNTRALYPGAGSGARGGSQGQTGQPGDQGSRDGSRSTDRQGEGGRGGVTGSPEFNLEGRQITTRPNIADRSQSEGQVVVLIWVDQRGRVLRAQAGHRGTTIQNEALWEKCKAAALNARFSAVEDGPEEQRGTITFLFKLE